MKILTEKPFEYLKRKEDNKPFEEDVVKNWYKARAFVLDKLKDVAFEPTSGDHLHVVVDVDQDDKQLSPLMLSVVRQIALSAHYLNFFEGSEKEEPCHRTVITLVSKNPQLRKELDKEEYLCNLLSYCKCVYKDSKTEENNDSYIDLEFHFVSKWTDDADYRFTEDEVNNFCETKMSQNEDIFSIDTRMASYAKRMYDLGVNIDNLPAEDIHCTERYSVAIDVFRYKMLNSRARLIIEEDKWKEKSLCKIKESLSNILCADCFEIRERSIEKAREEKINSEINPRVKYLENEIELWKESHQNKLKRWWVWFRNKIELWWLRPKGKLKLWWVKSTWVKKFKNQTWLWAEYNEPLSKSEHSRWVVEKLITGYSPLNDEERAHDASLQMQGSGKNIEYRNKLKRRDKDPAHIDLCPYRELRRTNPNDLKYDSFLMLAIPVILHKVRKRFLWFF